MSSLESVFRHTAEVVSAAQAELTKPSEHFSIALDNSAKHGLPPIAIGPSQGQFLSILCQLVQAKHILEIGTLGGYSTLFFATSTPGVQVTSLEIDPKHRAVALENLTGHDNVDIILGPALDTLPTLQGKPQFDFVFIDADWDEQTAYFDWAVKLVRKGGCIYVDNAVRQITETDDGVANPHAMALVDYIKADQRVNVAMIPTLNTHKPGLDGALDGFVMAIKK